MSEWTEYETPPNDDYDVIEYKHGFQAGFEYAIRCMESLFKEYILNERDRGHCDKLLQYFFDMAWKHMLQQKDEDWMPGAESMKFLKELPEDRGDTLWEADPPTKTKWGKWEMCFEMEVSKSHYFAHVYKTVDGEWTWHFEKKETISICLEGFDSKESAQLDFEANMNNLGPK